MTIRTSRRRATALIGGALTAPLFTHVTWAQNAAEPSDTLIRAAKAEGEFTFYTAATENVAKRVSEAFATRYGIRAKFTRLGGGQLVQRYSAEAQSGNIAADFVLIAGGAVAFIQDGVKNAWLDPIETAQIPAIESGTFPKIFLRYGGAIIQVSPWLVDYNTDRVKPADVPRTWEDILAPRFKSKILLNDPKSADSYLDMWATLADAFGESFFARLRAQNIRWYADGVPAVQALAAGEGDIFFPGVRYLVQGMVDKGAPLDTVMLDPTSGVEMFAALSARSKSRAPNAARLFAHYLLSPEGNKVFNQDPGNTSPYNRGELSKNYVSPKPETPGRRAEIRQLLGLQ